MMQPDVGAPIERDCFAGRFDLPQRHNIMSIELEHRWLIRALADDSLSNKRIFACSRDREHLAQRSRNRTCRLLIHLP